MGCGLLWGAGARIEITGLELVDFTRPYVFRLESRIDDRHPRDHSRAAREPAFHNQKRAQVHSVRRLVRLGNGHDFLSSVPTRCAGSED